jgi:predicted NAD/FAD-dependent oxidoreductase
VGGGVAGLLAAQRLCVARPEFKVLLVEMKSKLGGRLVTGGTAHEFGYGSQAITPKLYEFWNQALKTDPEADDLPSIMNHRNARAAILMGSKLTELDMADLCNEKGARALGGLAASRQWSDLKTLFESDHKFDHTLADLWKSPRKSPAPMVLETYSQAFGISNIWEASPGCIAEKASMITSKMFAGDWQSAFDALIGKFVARHQLDIKFDARVIHAEYSQESGWTLDTAQGEFFGRKIIIAQSPWAASQWIPKALWPSALATIVNKTKPVSTVTLSCPVESGDPSVLPDLIFIPSENCHAYISSKEIVFKTTIDYEMSMVAPDVVKAVKRLKRAHRKFTAATPDLVTGIEHLALLPVTWAQSPNFSERKYLDKLKFNSVQHAHMGFCGDAYGVNLDGDANIIESVVASSEAILK